MAHIQHPRCRELRLGASRLGRIWLHLRCIGRALAGICREMWPRRRAAAPSKASPYCAPARGPWGETR